jgi:tetratricopeptide (TPR) repeat protein
LVLPRYNFYQAYATFFADNDFEAARAEFLRAIQMNERCESCYRYFADASWITGRLSDCGPVLRRGLEVLPQSDALAVVWHSFLVRTEQFEEALRHAREFAGRRPKLHAAHRVLGLSLALLGRPAEAAAAYEECLRLSADDHPCLARLARAYAGMGDTARAEALRDRLIQLKASPVFLALVSMDLRRHDDALSYLEKALDGRDAGLYYLRVEPVWRPLWGTPRFEAIVNRSLARKRPNL